MRYALLPILVGLAACANDPQPAPPAAPASSAAALVAEDRLPIAYRAALTAAPAKRLDVWITADAIHLDEGPLFAATPKTDHAARWPAGRPQAARIAGLTLDAEAKARLRATLIGAFKRGGAEDLRLIADRDTPYALALDVFGIARAAGFKRWWIHARGRSKTGDFRTRRARWCTEAAKSPTPCTITWALLTTDRIMLQNRSDAEAACGTPPDVPGPPPASLVSAPRGKCRQLKHKGGQVAAAVIPPHRQKFIKGARCAYATLAAWPTVKWTQAVQVADGLRAAGHTTIALSRAAPDEACPAPAPTPAPASAPDSR